MHCSLISSSQLIPTQPKPNLSTQRPSTNSTHSIQQTKPNFKMSLHKPPKDHQAIIMEGSSNPSESMASLVDRMQTLEDALYASRNVASITHPIFPPHRQLANPSPLGLFGFAIVSTMAAVLKFSTDSTASKDGLFGATAIFLGGVAQIIAALFQFLHNNSHSATTFALFGLHWLSQGVQVFIQALTDVDYDAGHRPAAQATYYVLLSLAAFILWIPTLRMNRILNVTLLFVVFVFSLDVVAAYEVKAAKIASGVCAVIASALALYVALLEFVNEAWKRQVLPLFPHHEHKREYDQDDGVPYVPKRVFHKSAVSSVHL